MNVTESYESVNSHNWHYSSAADDEKLRRDLSDYADILSLILAEVGMPDKLRGFLDAVIGVAEGRREFECIDYELGLRLSGEKKTSNPESIAKRTQRSRLPFEEWQNKHQRILIDIEHGGKKQKTNYPTRYKLPILDAWVEAVRLVSAPHPWGGHYSKEEAAKMVAGKLCGTPTRKYRGNKRRNDDDARLQSSMKTSVTHARKSLELALERGDDCSLIVEEICRRIRHQAYLLTLGSEGHDELRVDTDVHPGKDSDSVHTPVVLSGQNSTQLRPDSAESVVPHRNDDDDDPALCSSDPLQQAIRMLGAFKSVGAHSFDVSVLGEAKLQGKGQKISYEPSVPAADLYARLPDLIGRTNSESLNLIVRPRAEETTLFQIDDVNRAGVDALRRYAFLILETSPDNFQVWLALDDNPDQQSFKERLKEVLSFDVGASGAARLAGSLNVKEKHRRPDGSYPLVHLVADEPGLLVDVESLEGDGFLPAQKKKSRPQRQRTKAGNRKPLPDADSFYARATHDISRADFALAATAAKREYSLDEIVEWLMEVSPKARRKGKRQGYRYALRTARAAIEA